MQRRHRLSRSRDFDAVYRQGRSTSTRFLVLYWFEREDEPGEPRLGLAVPKAAGNAVARACAGRPRLRAHRQAGAPRGRGRERLRLARGAGRRGADEGGRVRYLGVALVWAYRLTLRPFLGAGSCKYHPSCSQYAIDAYKEFGLFKGTVLAGWRLLRCNPWSRGGVDYARDQRVFT